MDLEKFKCFQKKFTNFQKKSSWILEKSCKKRVRGFEKIHGFKKVHEFCKKFHALDKNRKTKKLG